MGPKKIKQSKRKRKSHLFHERLPILKSLKLKNEYFCRETACSKLIKNYCFGLTEIIVCGLISGSSVSGLGSHLEGSGSHVPRPTSEKSCGSQVLGPVFRAPGLGSWVMGHGSWVRCSRSRIFGHTRSPRSWVPLFGYDKSYYELLGWTLKFSF